MEELIDAFAVSQVTIQPYTTAAEHPHFSLYKMKQNVANQEARRKKFLEEQKKKRYDYANHARKLATNDWSGDEANDEEEEEGMECEEIPKKPPKFYKNQLMLSEWLVDVPPDLDTQWLLLLCPVGKRCLVVSSRGKTKVYNRGGFVINSFSSLVPGGKFDCTKGGHAYSLLDCIYSELDKTFYILDVMCWNSHPCYDSETEFRFYWMHSKVDETPEVKNISKENPYKFLPLPYYNCDSESLKSVLWSSLPFPSKLDGLLFYHKRTHYTSGPTPLVGWLKAYMMPEILNIEVPNSLCADKPSSYISMQQYLPKAFEKSAERKKEDDRKMLYEDD